jgi:arylsulfatase A-like enzyme
MSRSPLLRSLLAALACTAAGVPASQAREAARPNVLIVVADDLGFSDLGAFGGEIATPNLDALARSGVRLANFHTEAACAPTRAMLLTGSDSHRVGLGNSPESLAPNQRGLPGYETHLRADTATLAERMAAAGYRTLFSGKWHLGVTPKQDPHARGFQHSFAMLNCCHNHFGVAPSAERTKMSAYTRDGQLVTDLPADFYSSDFFADEMVEQLRETRAGPDGPKPLFAYLAFTAPHAPLQAPAEAIARYKGKYDAGYDVLREQRLKRQRELGLLDPAVKPHHPVDTVSWDSLTPEEKRVSARKMEIYAAMVDRLDQAFGRVLAELRAGGELDNTVILFLSDNGAEARDPPPRPGMEVPYEAMGGPQGYVNYGAGWAQAATAPSWRFKSFATEGGIHAPAFVTGPGVANPGSISSAYTNVLDVVPTVLDLAEVPLERGTFAGRSIQPIDGLSWKPLLTGQVASVYPPDRVIGTELFGSRSIRRGDWKITDIGDGVWHLFNVAEDPGETRDLAQLEPARMAEMLRAWEAWSREVGAVIPDPPNHPNPPRDHD